VYYTQALAALTLSAQTPMALKFHGLATVSRFFIRVCHVIVYGNTVSGLLVKWTLLTWLPLPNVVVLVGFYSSFFKTACHLATLYRLLTWLSCGRPWQTHRRGSQTWPRSWPDIALTRRSEPTYCRSEISDKKNGADLVHIIRSGSDLWKKTRSGSDCKPATSPDLNKCFENDCLEM
jgi:TM2 domain-containing membrane protein YozV